MGATGYCWHDRAEVEGQAETIPGPTTDSFAAIPRSAGVHIVVGKHRKSHPYISGPKWAAPGDLGHQVFETPLGRIALSEADVICHVSNRLSERTPAPYWISCAFKNCCCVVESNRWGLERTVQFSGGSCVVEPDGRIAAVIDGGDGVVRAEIDTAVLFGPERVVGSYRKIHLCASDREWATAGSGASSRRSNVRTSIFATVLRSPTSRDRRAPSRAATAGARCDDVDPRMRDAEAVIVRDSRNERLRRRS